MKKIFPLVPFILILIFTTPSQAVILFQDSYDNDANWNCSMSVPSQRSGLGWTSESGCIDPPETWNSATHYDGEINSPGKGGTGKDLKLWMLSIPQAIQVTYSGGQSTATVQVISGSLESVALRAPAGTVIDSLDANQLAPPACESGGYCTLNSVVSWINSYSGWSAKLGSGLSGSEMAQNLQETWGTCGSYPDSNNQCPVNAIGGMWIGWFHPAYFCGFLNLQFPQTYTYRDLYVGWDIKYPSGFDIKFNSTQFQKWTRFCPMNSDGSNECDWGMDTLWGWTYGTSVIGFDACNDPKGWHVTSETISEMGFVDGNWHRMVIHAKINDPETANGAIEFWVDGNNYLSVTNYNLGFTGQYFNNLILTPGFGNFAGEYNFPDTNWRAVEWDNYVVATTYQEAATTTPTPRKPATIIPTPPTNLHISPN